MKDRKLLAFGWFGGKAAHLNFILPILKAAEDMGPVRCYAEHFGGSAAVLLNRAPAPVEVYNDMFGAVPNFFRILRDHPVVLREKLALTPFSRAEYVKCLAPEPGLDDIERARRFFVVARQVRGGLATSATPGKWAFCRTESSRGMGQTIAKWESAMSRLDRVAERLRRVYIECGPAEESALRYDTPETLHYFDPPYVHATRTDGGTSYALEMDEGAHRRFAGTVRALKGRVAISGYDGPLYDELFGGWFKHAGPIKAASSTRGTRADRQEFVWTNYEVRATQ
jgi:DNA adenine methylase